jgi:hypothetical protein
VINGRAENSVVTQRDVGQTLIRPGFRRDKLKFVDIFPQN